MGICSSSKADDLSQQPDRDTTQRNHFKVVLLGETNVGKTALYQRLMNDDFDDAEHEPTVGMSILLLFG